MRPPFVCNEHYYPDAVVKTLPGWAVLTQPVNVFTQAARMQQCATIRTLKYFPMWITTCGCQRGCLIFIIVARQ